MKNIYKTLHWQFLGVIFLKAILFIGTYIGTILCTSLFVSIIPGGDEDTKILWGAISTLISVVVVCTKVIIEKLDETKR